MSGETDEVVDLLADWLASLGEPPALVIATSGSTGAPKRVRLSRRAILASAQATHARLGGPRPWTLMLPVSYVAGVQVVVRSLLAGGPPSRAPTGQGYVSLVPTQLYRLLEEQPGTLAAYDAVLVGGGATDPALLARARDAGVRVVRTYGMSETAGGCVYDGVPLDGVDLRIAEDGRIEIAGPMLFDGYEGSDRVGDWFRTDDLGEFVDGRLRVLGRADDVINSGGVKVGAAAVARRLREHPAVAAAEVLGVPDPEWGECVVAYVVGDLDLQAARDWVAATLPRTWAPRRVVRLPALPLLPHGKADRLALRRLG